MTRRLEPGTPYPLGATWDGLGVNFALFSESATRVELCLFPSPGATRESARFDLPERTDHVWHGYLAGAQPGQLYGYRVHGPYEPESGLRFNPAKVVLDPYAKSVGRLAEPSDENFGYRLGDPDQDLARDDRDNAAVAPLAAVIDPNFVWGDDRPPRTPWHETLICELHVRGFTVKHPEIPEAARGTFSGLASKPAVEHLRSLGVTAVELMPVHWHFTERHLAERGLTNYWGYNTLSYFAPDPRFATPGAPGDAVREFKMMVRALHAAGIEVILDVVYNHTGEGDHLGPTLSLKGIDNAAYYRLSEADRRFYVDFTGCGNTLDMTHPHALQLVMDSLRYWILDMHVDGFRFDLASTLAREVHDVNRLAAFFDIIHQDPVINRVKLIAEPWDLGEGGYQAGNFPVRWAEWNGKYRDSVRRFWRGDGGTVSELATRLAGSADLYASSGRSPYASVNFVTAHDGFTLQDLVSYNEKHNEANLEENADGENHNWSWNGGVEGPTEDPAVASLRERQKKNLMATLLVSQGVPMIRGGDELSQSQQGNNNAYCQDNPISWVNWTLTPEQRKFLEYCRLVIRLRKEHGALRHRRFLHGEPLPGTDLKDITWIAASGGEMTEQDWNEPHARCLGVRLVGADEPGAEGTAKARPLLVLFHAGEEPVSFRLPPDGGDTTWEVLLDTSTDGAPARGAAVTGSYPLDGRSMAVLRARVP